MNVYDKAHELCDAIKMSNEYMEYSRLRKEIENNPEIDKMLKDFQSKQITLQAKQMAGENLEPEELQQIKELLEIINTDPTAAQYMQAEMRFSVMIGDVYKLLGELIDIDKRMGKEENEKTAGNTEQNNG